MLSVEQQEIIASEIINILAKNEVSHEEANKVLDATKYYIEEQIVCSWNELKEDMDITRCRSN